MLIKIISLATFIRAKYKRGSTVLTEAGVVCEVAVERFALRFVGACAPAVAPQADGDVRRAAVAVVWRHIRT